MMNRLMDLVVLLAELSQKNDNSFKELDKELKLKGYSSEEIEQALSWISAKNDSIQDEGHPLYRDAGMRVLSSWERLCLDAESHRYLRQLLSLGIINANQLERILGRLSPFSGEKIDITEIKAIACAVIFNMRFPDPGEEPFDLLDDEFNRN